MVRQWHFHETIIELQHFLENKDIYVCFSIELFIYGRHFHTTIFENDFSNSLSLSVHKAGVVSNVSGD